MGVMRRSHVPGAKLFREGKVREVYEAAPSSQGGPARLVIVASDRLSAFDVVLPTPIPDKGRVLTQISSFWFGKTRHIVPNHLIETEIERFPVPFRELPSLVGRAVLVSRCERVDIECVARGYLAGSAWTEYRKDGTVAGERLPPRLKESAQLPEPIFTPATKAITGHDENISRAQLAAMVGKDLAKRLEDVTLALYRFAHAYALGRGLILADTKFEFGFDAGELTLIDEALTPDSSRYWDADTYRPGTSPPSFDKQYVRDHLIATGWDRAPPGPALPKEVVQGTTQRYRECYFRITGKEL
ncbi:MAG: phosphoribosylaminoimidazolesuccinocarboxamide synthase [Candidatus Limnocylindria bacterium]